MADQNDLLALVPGRRAIITACEAREHGDNNGCVCGLKGRVVTLGQLYDTPFAGTPSWHLKGRRERVRLAEITFVANAGIDPVEVLRLHKAWEDTPQDRGGRNGAKGQALNAFIVARDTVLALEA